MLFVFFGGSATLGTFNCFYIFGKMEKSKKFNSLPLNSYPQKAR